MKRKNRVWICPLLVAGLSLVLFSACKKDVATSLPTLTTTAISGITTTTATSGGNISNDGGGRILDRGVCWSTAHNPTTGNSKTSSGDGDGSFTSSISGLTANKTYYVRAYAQNTYGFGYGAEVSFKTALPGNPSMSATVDGVPFTATSITVVHSSGTIGATGISGTKNMLLWFPEAITTGSHSLSLYGSYKAQYSPSGTGIFSSQSGTMNITEYDMAVQKVKGTFDFIGTDFSTTINVTSGQFEIYI
jgi:hypothetical protein